MLRNLLFRTHFSAIVIALAGCCNLPAQVSYRTAPAIELSRPVRAASSVRPATVPHAVMAVRATSTKQSGSTQSGNTPVNQTSSQSGGSSPSRPGGAVVNLPVCAGSAAVDDTPQLMSVIRTAGMNTFYVSPEAPCYVHFTGQNTLPAGTKLMGTPGRSILRLNAGGSGQTAAQDDLMYIGPVCTGGGPGALAKRMQNKWFCQ